MTAFWRYLLLTLGLAGALAVAFGVIYLAALRHSGLDLSRSKATAAGVFVVSIAPESAVVQQGQAQNWLLTLKTAAGAPVENAAIDVSGGMPQTNQALPTSPQVTDYLGSGRYLVQGVKFSQPGWWQLRVGISAAAGSDTVVFNIVL
ncbi:FixH family protein [Mesorhizobium sp. SP-1A]|uniref:FixH family protein n=1 Tax=Mesorhizobium sp. SP-1A TaxID=3077840 RepID=UPI0028F71B88|nr:FixH family protein [Mesorhizobium sp. SP-1A]